MTDLCDMQLFCGDCLEIMPELAAKSVDMVLCDLPYGTTACKWDQVIPFDALWKQYNRVIKEDGIILLFGQQPFTSVLISSNFDMFRYTWVWDKINKTGFLNANYAPLKQTEDICIFSQGTVGSLSKNPIKYFPQGVKVVNKQKRNNPKSNWRKNKGYGGNNKLNSNLPYTQKYTNYPSNILSYKIDKPNCHPCQKPVALLEYLIKTYTNAGDLVLDNCMGSGSTGVACVNTGRRFIGIEKEKEYFEIAKQRIKDANYETTN